MTANNNRKVYYSPHYLLIMIIVHLRRKPLNIHLDLRLRNIVNRLEDRRLASHKVEEVDKLISEQKWKIKETKFNYHLSFLSYVGTVTISFVMIILLFLLLQIL
jgi:hypothetical protein